MIWARPGPSEDVDLLNAGAASVGQVTSTAPSSGGPTSATPFVGSADAMVVRESTATSRSNLMAPIAAARGGQRARKGAVPSTDQLQLSKVLVQVGVDEKPGEWRESGGVQACLSCPGEVLGGKSN